MAGRKVFAVQSILQSADVNGYLMDQTVPRFTTTTERDGQWPSPPNGAMCITVDTYRRWLRWKGVWIREAPAVLYRSSSTSTAESANWSTTAITIINAGTIPVYVGRAYRCHATIPLVARGTTGTIGWLCRLQIGGAVVQSHEVIGGTNYNVTYHGDLDFVHVPTVDGSPSFVVDGLLTWYAGASAGMKHFGSAGYPLSLTVTDLGVYP